MANVCFTVTVTKFDDPVISEDSTVSLGTHLASNLKCIQTLLIERPEGLLGWSDLAVLTAVRAYDTIPGSPNTVGGGQGEKERYRAEFDILIVKECPGMSLNAALKATSKVLREYLDEDGCSLMEFADSFGTGNVREYDPDTE